MTYSQFALILTVFVVVVGLELCHGIGSAITMIPLSDTLRRSLGFCGSYRQVPQLLLDSSSSKKGRLEEVVCRLEAPFDRDHFHGTCEGSF